MELFTPIRIGESHFPIDYDSRILSIGSCFAVNMAEKFSHYQFRSSVNPFGILFHPTAIENFIRHADEGKVFTESDIFFHNERWHCFDAHSDLSHPDKNILIGSLNKATAETHSAINKATHVIITLGTAWVYRNASGNLVANCHKVSQREFSKELLSIETIVGSLENTIGLLRQNNPDVQIILTVSPVRHIKDGFVENQRSKSHLIAAMHQVLDNGRAGNHYFPSYEIMMDELRDYRFYAEDLLHPNQTAIDYIWEKFAAAWISSESRAIMDEVDAVRKALAHRPFNPESESHKVFVQSVSQKIAALRQRFGFMEF